MDELKISLAQVADCAMKIRTCSQQMYDHLQNMKQEMSKTSGSWISEGGETIRMRFQQFAARFENQKQLIDSYAQFLDRAVESYDSLESTIVSNASGMQA
jgi:uncharacterized protein YukE